jgi:hypothetical protein
MMAADASLLVLLVLVVPEGRVAMANPSYCYSTVNVRASLP